MRHWFEQFTLLLQLLIAYRLINIALLVTFFYRFDILLG